MLQVKPALCLSMRFQKSWVARRRIQASETRSRRSDLEQCMLDAGGSTFPSAPIILRFAVHYRRILILALDPVPRATGRIGGIATLAPIPPVAIS